MEINAPKDFLNDFDIFNFAAKMQSEICNAQTEHITIHFPNGNLFKNRIGVFVQACLVAWGLQKFKKVDFKFDAPSTVWDKKNPEDFFQFRSENDVILLISSRIHHNIPIQMTEKFEEILVSLMAEVYNNAVEHSEGDYIIGNCYTDIHTANEKSRMFLLGYDTGIGIIESVRRFLEKNTDDEFHTYKTNVGLLKWALGEGHTTKQPPRGLGMNWLLDFAKLNSGYIRICNENVLFEQNAEGEMSYKKLENPFYGLFFEMHIVETPNVIYKLKGE